MILLKLNTEYTLITMGFAAAGGGYAAIAALVNIPAIIFGAYLYEIFLTDSDRGAFFLKKKFLAIGSPVANFICLIAL